MLSADMAIAEASVPMHQQHEQKNQNVAEFLQVKHKVLGIENICRCPGGGRWPGLSSSAFRTRAAVGEEAKARSSFDDVKRACKQMVRKCRTDVSPPDRAEEYTRRFIEVQEAYETLSDPRRGCFSLSPPGGALMRLVISR
ncbi:hypothetical protein B296_00040675 [Ensete ventricosum]|uniref:J domain-containing protein n=1 Tax=Ensete ventricosum TaxID=4639 RepID=A0A426YGF2_ENSVE|nr:hypothetical protein B296_00040675 [Ensete ventricosum]